MNVYLGIGIPWLAAAIYWASASGVKTSANPGLKTQPTPGGIGKGHAGRLEDKIYCRAA